MTPLQKVYILFDKESLEDLWFHAEKVNDKFVPKRPKEFPETHDKRNLYQILDMIVMAEKTSQIMAHGFIKHIAVKSYCEGINFARDTIRNELSFWKPILCGISIGASAVGLAWWLKTKNYF